MESINKSSKFREIQRDQIKAAARKMPTCRVIRSGRILGLIAIVRVHKNIKGVWVARAFRLSPSLSGSSSNDQTATSSLLKKEYTLKGDIDAGKQSRAPEGPEIDEYKSSFSYSLACSCQCEETRFSWLRHIYSGVVCALLLLAFHAVRALRGEETATALFASTISTVVFPANGTTEAVHQARDKQTGTCSPHEGKCLDT